MLMKNKMNEAVARILQPINEFFDERVLLCGTSIMKRLLKGWFQNLGGIRGVDELTIQEDEDKVHKRA